MPRPPDQPIPENPAPQGSHAPPEGPAPGGAAMAAAAAGWQSPWRALAALGRELAAEWAAQDVRAALCQLLLLWLALSLLGVRLAWRAYGGAVAALCYRTGPTTRRTTGATSGPARPRAHSLSPASPAGRNGAAERHCPPR